MNSSSKWWWPRVEDDICAGKTFDPGSGHKHLSRLVYQAATNDRGRNLGSFLCRGREFNFFSFIYLFSSFQNSFRIFRHYHTYSTLLHKY